MQDSTWRLLEEWFAAWPRTRAVGATDEEISVAARVVGVPWPPDYLEFLKRYGGAIVGAYPILGIQKCPAQADDTWSVVALNQEYRLKNWPAVDNWLVFSVDLGGNPVGFDASGRVYVSDAESREVVEIASDFETYLLDACLEVE